MGELVILHVVDNKFLCVSNVCKVENSILLQIDQRIKSFPPLFSERTSPGMCEEV